MSDSASFPTHPATPANGDPLVGKVLGERYRLGERIGEGGMGTVYRAEHLLMKKTVAVKLLQGDLVQMEEVVGRFQREAQSASRLSHPNIIGVTDFGRAADGTLFLVMEYVPGQSLASALAAAGRLAVPRALSIVRQILRALAHAHQQGVIHRDLKPANIMLKPAPRHPTPSGPSQRSSAGRSSPDGAAGEEVVKILDFGIAKLTQDLTEGERPLTRAAMVFGTPSYMSPEQATAQDADTRADLYSCGIILYEMLTGRKPFVAPELAKVLAMQVTARPPRFSTVAPDANLPAALEEVVMRALEKDRDQRYPSAVAFLEALDSLETAAAPGAWLSEAMANARLWRTRLGVLWAEVRARYQRLPWGVRRFSPFFGVLGVVLLLVAVPSLCSSGDAVHRAPPPPKPVVAGAGEALQKVDKALGQGQLAEARAMLLRLLSQYPEEARVRFLLGNLEIAEGRALAGLEEYRQALTLDPGMRGDPALLRTVRTFLRDPDKKLAWTALTLVTERVGAPASADLVAIGSEDRRPEFRRAARTACQDVGCEDQIDWVRSYALDLGQARTCEDKRVAIVALGETGDPKAKEPLRRARSVRGLFGGLFGGGNQCVRKDIEAALERLGE